MLGGEHSANKITIMVVDDERDVLATTRLMLERSDYLVHAFDDPTLALQHLKTNGCKDCVITLSDIKMPVMTGLELARYVKQSRPEMKVVLMTSFAIHKEEWQKVLPSTGIDGFIRKPFTMAEITEEITKQTNEHLQPNDY